MAGRARCPHLAAAGSPWPLHFVFFCPTNSQFDRYRRGCWTQILTDNRSAMVVFCSQTSARLLHTVANEYERQPDHTSRHQAARQRRTRRPTEPHQNPPQAGLDVCFIQSFPGSRCPAVRPAGRAGSESSQTGEEEITRQGAMPPLRRSSVLNVAKADGRMCVEPVVRRYNQAAPASGAVLFCLR